MKLIKNIINNIIKNTAKITKTKEDRHKNNIMKLTKISGVKK